MVEYTDPLNAIFAALSDPTRRGIMERLSKGETRVTDLAEPFDMSLAAVSKHVKVLERAGLVIRTKDGRVHNLNANPKPVQQARDWCAMYAAVWQEQFDALDELLKAQETENQ